MRQLLDVCLVNGPFGDPGLYVDLRDERRALLFDLGDISALSPRKLLRLSHVFISHTHMDHFIGFDQLLRVVLGRKQQLTLIGGPGLVAQVEHKLRAYTWNVVQRYQVALVLEVQEVHPDGQGKQACFGSHSGFARDGDAPLAARGDVLLDDGLLRVRGRFVDHGMPCLAFAIEEKPRPRVAKNRLAAMGLGTGAWLGALRLAIQSGAPASTPLQLHWRDRLGEHTHTRSVGELAAMVLDFSPGLRIGYVTDLCDTEANHRVLAQLLGGVDRLYIESGFLHADRAQAERKHHLTAQQAGCIAGSLQARALVPFHFSPRYMKHGGALADEARAAWLASIGAPRPAADVDAASALQAPGAWTRAMR